MTPSSVALKLVRARQHLAELRRGVNEYLGSGPFDVYIDADLTSGPAIHRVHVKAEPPAELALPLGDAVHNARSALDHVACRLVEANGGSTDHTSFPTGKSRSEFSKAVKSGMKGATEAAKDAVRALNVYPGGDNELWCLHRLDIGDKHKLLIPVAMSYRSLNLHIGFGDLQLDPLQLLPADPLFPVTEGAEVLRIEEQPRFADSGGLDQDYSFSFDLALDPAATASERPTPVIEGVTALIDHAETVANELLGHL